MESMASEARRSAKFDQIVLTVTIALLFALPIWIAIQVSAWGAK